MYFTKVKNRYFEWYKKTLVRRTGIGPKIWTNLSPNPARLATLGRTPNDILMRASYWMA